MATTMVDDSETDVQGSADVHVFVNGSPTANAIAGDNVRAAARSAAQDAGLVQYTVRVNNRPANLEATLQAGDTLAIEATTTKG